MVKLRDLLLTEITRRLRFRSIGGDITLKAGPDLTDASDWIGRGPQRGGNR